MFIIPWASFNKSQEIMKICTKDSTVFCRLAHQRINNALSARLRKTIFSPLASYYWKIPETANMQMKTRNCLSCFQTILC